MSNLKLQNKIKYNLLYSCLHFNDLPRFHYSCRPVILLSTFSLLLPTSYFTLHFFITPANKLFSSSLLHYSCRQLICFYTHNFLITLVNRLPLLYTSSLLLLRVAFTLHFIITPASELALLYTSPLLLPANCLYSTLYHYSCLRVAFTVHFIITIADELQITGFPLHLRRDCSFLVELLGRPINPVISKRITSSPIVLL